MPAEKITSRVDARILNSTTADEYEHVTAKIREEKKLLVKY
jgi:hypothetical protein